MESLDCRNLKFIKPTPKPELGGELGLYASEIAESLGSRNEKVRRKLSERGMLERLNGLGYSAIPFGVPNETNGLEFTEYALSVEAAKFFVAKYNNEVGDRYLSFLINLEEKVSNLRSRAAKDPLASVAMCVADVRIEQLDMKDDIDAINQRLDDTPKMIEEKLSEMSLGQNEFPADCLRVDEICNKYFPGIAQKKVLNWLKHLRHPRGEYIRRDEKGFFHSRPFKKEGLEEASRRLSSERKQIKTTPKLFHYYHPGVGTFQIDKALVKTELSLAGSPN